MRLIYERMKLVAEPSGAVGLAAALDPYARNGAFLFLCLSSAAACSFICLLLRFRGVLIAGLLCWPLTIATAGPLWTCCRRPAR